MVTKTKRLFLSGLFISVVMLLSSCTLITDLEIYKLDPSDKTNVMLNDNNISVSVQLRVTGGAKLYIPIFYQKYIEKDPYRVLITIDGDIDDIEIIQSKALINQGEEAHVFNLSRTDFEYSPLSDGTPYFYLKKERYLDYPWEKISEVEFIFEFYGIKNGIKTKYQARKTFKPEFESFITNDAMSI